jgi:hypothetical protein
VPYLTRSQVVGLARRQRGFRTAAAELREAATTASFDQTFDVFVSHSSKDADLIWGVKLRLELDGLQVYVDWIVDPQLDRTRVSKATAAILRQRMKQCRFLVYVATAASRDSRWMPWELGYFDGLRRGRVGILPIDGMPGADFPGVEYLGLYPKWQEIEFDYPRRRLIARMISQESAQTLVEAARA